MYRHSDLGLARSCAIMHSLRPDEVEADDGAENDKNLMWELERKREELTEEIRRFTMQKEKEFREFERELRGRRISHNKQAHAHNTALSLLAETKKIQEAKVRAERETEKSRKKAKDRSRSPKTSIKTPASKPTLSLEKTNVNGMTTPPVVDSPRALRPVICRSPVIQNIALTPPRVKSPKPGTPLRDKEDPLTGLFTPAYLPLLEGRPDPKSPTRSPPISPRPGQTKRLSHNLPLPLQDLAVEIPMASSSLPTDTSIPPATATPPETSPRLFKRTLSVPGPSSSLPSALRTSSRPNRKGKHVTFQMNDGKVVEPSSSYEETPSPDPPESLGEERNRTDVIAEIATIDAASTQTKTGPVVRGMLAANESAPAQPEEKTRINGLNGLGISSISSISGSSGGGSKTGLGPLDLNEDGGSGVGFFELDEELESPSPMRSPRSASAGDGFFDDPDADGGDVGVDAGSREKRKTRTNGNGNGKSKEEEAEELKYGSFTAGSVPIDIVRPSGSWIGSFGH